MFGSDQYKDRRTNELDPFVRYIAINVNKVPNLDQRKAIATALDRAQLRTVAGGAFAGDLADGVIKPNLPADYAPSGMWDGCSGRRSRTPATPSVAKALIAQSGEPMKTLQFDYPQTPANDRGPPPLVGSLGKAGIKVRPNPIEAGQFYGIVLDPAQGRRPGPRRLGTGLVERVDGHPGAVHADRWLRPLAGQRQGVQREGRRGARR